jgi:hypothetical protein
MRLEGTQLKLLCQFFSSFQTILLARLRMERRRPY